MKNYIKRYQRLNIDIMMISYSNQLAHLSLVSVLNNRVKAVVVILVEIKSVNVQKLSNSLSLIMKVVVVGLNQLLLFLTVKVVVVVLSQLLKKIRKLLVVEEKRLRIVMIYHLLPINRLNNLVVQKKRMIK